MLPYLSVSNGKSFILPQMGFRRKTKTFSTTLHNLEREKKSKYLYTVSISVNPPDPTVVWA